MSIPARSNMLPGARCHFLHVDDDDRALFGALPAVGTWSGRFFHALARKAARALPRT